MTTTKAYIAERRKLIADMGGKCAHCGESNPAKLEFGHTRKRDWTPNRLSHKQRIAMYRRDWERGILQLECCRCNKAHRTEAGFVALPRRLA